MDASTPVTFVYKLKKSYNPNLFCMMRGVTITLDISFTSVAEFVGCSGVPSPSQVGYVIAW